MTNEVATDLAKADRALECDRRRAVPILMYHQVSPDAPPAFSKWVVAPGIFMRQMRWLAVAGYVPITLTALRAGRLDGKPLPGKPIVLTFDDGYRDCVRYAVEALQHFGFTAVFFPVAGLVGRTSRWLVRERGLDLPLAGWPELHRLLEQGFEVGAHSLTHPRLATLADDDVRYELGESKRIIEESLGVSIAHLAYPYGSFDDRVRRLAAAAGYHTACTVEIGVSVPDEDFMALHRVPVIGSDSLLDFFFRLRSGHAARSTLGGFLRRLGASPRPGLERT